MQLRVLSTMVEVAAEKNSTLIFPIPVELLRLIDAATARSDAPPPTDKPDSPAAPLITPDEPSPERSEIPR
jgi:hypothetical protein